MLLSAGMRRRLKTGLFLCVMMVFAAPVFAQQRFVIAVLTDGPSDRFENDHQQYINELLALTSGEFDVQIRRRSGDWTRESIARVLDETYSDPDIDMVLVTGFISNQIAAIRREFSKPTFLPQIIDTALIERDGNVGRSGVRNLNYLTAYADFGEDLDTLSRFIAYRDLVLFVDAGLASAIQMLQDRAFAASADRGINLQLITHDGVDHDLMRRVPADTDAVFVAGLPRMPEADFSRLISAINAAGLPSYSFIGVRDVERGLLVTNSEPSDIDRQARLNALNMQAVMLGGRAEDQPIASLRKEQLTINMATARSIALSPTFDLLDDAILLNQDVEATGEQYGLVDIARLALEQNLDLQAEGFGVQAGLQEIARARANLLPQVGASYGQTIRKDSPAVGAGLFAERSSDAVVSIDQLLYSDAASANLKIQKELQRTRLASLEEFKLDVVQAASIAYYNALNARSQFELQEKNLRITRTNLELAKDRVRLGTSTRADVHRWEAEDARSQIAVYNARAALQRAWETLNRIVQKPLGQPLALKEASFDDPFVMPFDEVERMIQSPEDYNRFSRFYIDRALSQAPELHQLDAQIEAKRREYVSTKRAYWLPDFTVGGLYTENIDQSGIGAGPQAGREMNDWSVGIQATLPLFSGGLKRANVSRAGFELRQLEALRASTALRVEEGIRNELHTAQAAYAQIELSATAAEASRKNFELVSDAYARGTVNIIELLDAQDSSLAASAAAAESTYNFLITIMSMHRAIGSFDFLLTREAQEELAATFRLILTGTR